MKKSERMVKLQEKIDLLNESLPEESGKNYGRIVSVITMLEEEQASIAADVIAEGNARDVPIDIEELINQMGSGAKIRNISVSSPRLTSQDLRTYEGDYVNAIDKRVETIHAGVQLALGIIVKAAGA